MLSIAKAATELTDMEYRAAPGRHRPPTLANPSQKLLAKGVDYMLDDVVTTTLPPIQHGFVRGRQILDTTLSVPWSSR